jgi:hypothetical protein
LIANPAGAEISMNEKPLIIWGIARFKPTAKTVAAADRWNIDGSKLIDYQ